MHSDIWSLGILLMNLVVGQKPWRSADPQRDKDFAAYVRRPSHFLSTRFPISRQLRHLLLETLTLNSRERISLPRLRMAVENTRTFYSPEAVFLDGVALCVLQIDRVNGANIDTSMTNSYIHPSFIGNRAPYSDTHRTLKSHKSWDDWPDRRHAGFWELPKN